MPLPDIYRDFVLIRIWRRRARPEDEEIDFQGRDQAQRLPRNEEDEEKPEEDGGVVV